MELSSEQLARLAQVRARFVPLRESLLLTDALFPPLANDPFRLAVDDLEWALGMIGGDVAPTVPAWDDYTSIAIVIDYTNHRGVRALRRILPLRVKFEASAWHPEAQWLLTAIDLVKGEVRAFALKDVHAWDVPFIVPPAPGASIWTLKCETVGKDGVRKIEQVVLSAAAHAALADFASRPERDGQIRHLIEAILFASSDISLIERGLLERFLQVNP
jgi:hypothetical protein